MRIGDDGRGFDTGSITAEHLGLSIMREPAASIGAALDISSRAGKGTRVKVVWSDHAPARPPGTKQESIQQQKQ
jgi:nitrate/nitrite-specific signal transduction histidine kinase